MCGSRFTRQKDNFPFSYSPYFKGNNSYLPICSNCLVAVTDQYQEILNGNQEDAIKRVALHWDIYVSESLLQASRKIDGNRPRIKNYISKLNLGQTLGKTYDDYLQELISKRSSVLDNIDEMDELRKKALQDNTVNWGSIYSEQEFDVLNTHYEMLTKQIDAIDFVQETLIRDLCEIKIQQIRVLGSGDLDKYDKLTKLYQSTLLSAKLKPTNGSAIDENNDAYGKWINDIERFTPAEFYKDKTKYKDFFGIGEYIERFMYRPLKNLMTGSKDKEKEFWIEDEKDGDQSCWM